jgi:glycerol-1-phosphate dehydrogenase [NAD(P)+]
VSDAVEIDDLESLRRLLSAAPEALAPIGLREVVRGRDALSTLPSVLQRNGVATDASVVVLSDTTPKRYANRDVLDVTLDALSTRPVGVVRVAPHEGNVLVLATESTIAASVAEVRAHGPDVLVSVGSGTLVDIAKVVSRELSIPHVVVQSAASVNGFADNQSVLLIDGVKRTTPSQWPTALVIDPWVVAEAPNAMTRSGLGDELSMFTAGADWYLSNAVGFDASYSPTVTALMRRGVDDLLARASDVGRGEQRAVGLLASLLTVSGLAMGVAGRTAPSSGSEHLVSHLLEMDADASQFAGASHGSQVGAASVLAAIVWRRVRDHFGRGGATVDLGHLADREHVLRAFSHLDATGATAEECWQAYQRKASWIQEHVDSINDAIATWPEHDRVIEGLLKPVDVVSSALRRARAPIAFSQLDPAPKPEVVAWAVANCHRMRDRFTVFDLAELLGLWSERDVAEVLSEHQGLAR